MKILFVIFFFLITNCSSVKKTSVCGDRECINNSEKKEYFEKNLSMEVIFDDKKKKKYYDLVDLNIKNINTINQNETMLKTKTRIKKLSNKEKKIIKINKKKLKKKQLVKKTEKNKQITKKETSELKTNLCKNLENCNIEKISELLTKEGKKKKYPNLSF